MGDGMDISEVARNNYAQKDEQFREILAILMMFTCGLSGRGTEMTSLRWMNTMDGDRSIYIEDRQLMFVTEYHKSMALMDDQKVRVNIHG
jgi:predicted metal-binding protein